MAKVTFEERYFKNHDEWDYFLGQLGIPTDKRDRIDEVEVEVMTDDISATDIDGNELKVF